MKLQQLRYAVEVFRRNLNVSDAADALFTSQPGVSKQIRLLEEELGTQIFIRSGKRIVAVTQAGVKILETAEQILRNVQNIKNIGGEFSDTQSGALTIAATHSLLRFRLSETISAFQAAYPDVRLILKQGSPAEIAEMVFNGEADLGVGKDVPQNATELRKLSYSAWRYVLILPHEHKLAHQSHITLTDIAAHPLLTYDFTFDTGSAAARAFARAKLATQTVFTSDDSAILKQYVRLGLGIGLLDDTAFHTTMDTDLAMRDIGHLFEPCEYKILLRGDALLRGYAYDFMQLLHPSLTRDRINHLMYAPAIEDFSI